MKFHKIFGSKINFYKLLEEQSIFIINSADALQSYMETQDQDYADQVKSLEEDADDKRRELIQNLNNTFITPFDREDIFTLSKSLDDILDYFKTTVNQMEIYAIEPAPELISFTQLLQAGSKSIHDAVCCMKTNPAESVKNAMKAKKSENKVEALYRNSIAELLMGNDIKYIIKMRELYRHLSNCADKIDHSADLGCHILMKEVSY